jgi:biopolymer transport protein ExbB/TolQ
VYLLSSNYFPQILVFQWICLLNIAVSLANALNRASALEAKLKATTKALEEAHKKCAKEVAATKLAANQAVKEVEARAINAEKALAKVSKRQTQHEEAVVKRIDDLLTSFGSKYHLTASSLVLL